MTKSIGNRNDTHGEEVITPIHRHHPHQYWTKTRDTTSTQNRELVTLPDRHCRSIH